MGVTTKPEPTSDQSSQLDAPITLTPDQIAEAAGGTALAAASLIWPPTTIGLINPDILNPDILMKPPAPTVAL
jgi:hypothetical protein